MSWRPTDDKPTVDVLAFERSVGCPGPFPKLLTLVT
jgi:hypothetical protein